MTPLPKRKIIGVQVHHSQDLSNASAYGANMLTALEAAISKSDKQELKDLYSMLARYSKQISEHQRKAQTQMRTLSLVHPETFKQCVDGRIPWPDETEEGFEARCTCNDQCAIHDLGKDQEDFWICTCGECPQHVKSK